MDSLGRDWLPTGEAKSAVALAEPAAEGGLLRRRSGWGPIAVRRTDRRCSPCPDRSHFWSGKGHRPDSLFGHSVGVAFNQRRNGVWLRHIDSMTARNLDDCRTRALGHETLRRRRNHLVVGGDQIPTGLGPPCRLTDRAVQSFEAPRNLRVSHE